MMMVVASQPNNPQRKSDISMATKIVTHKEMVDFINSQPDDRIVNFNEIDFDSECGCVMLHYFKDKEFIPLKFCKGLGVSTFNDKEHHALEESYLTYIPVSIEPKTIFTYKELKEYIND
jgi:hypothetical protein